MDAAFRAASLIRESKRSGSSACDCAFVSARANASLRSAAFSCEMLSSTFFAAERFFGSERDSFFAFFIVAMQAGRFAGGKSSRVLRFWGAQAASLSFSAACEKLSKAQFQYLFQCSGVASASCQRPQASSLRSPEAANRVALPKPRAHRQLWFCGEHQRRRPGRFQVAHFFETGLFEPTLDFIKAESVAAL